MPALHTRTVSEDGTITFNKQTWKFKDSKTAWAGKKVLVLPVKEGDNKGDPGEIREHGDESGTPVTKMISTKPKLVE